MYQREKLIKGIKISKSKRIIIFIDHGNVFHELSKLKFKIDYRKLKMELSQGYKLIKAILYMGVIYPIDPSLKGWLKSLNRKGIEVKTKYIKTLSSGRKYEKAIDVLLAVDMVSYAYNNIYDKALLVSGDADFIPAIDKVIELEKEIEVWSFKTSLSKQLEKYLDDILNKIKK